MKFTHEADYNDIIQAAGTKWNVDPNIIKGVIAQESNFIATAYRFEPYNSPTTGQPRTWLSPTTDFPNGGDASFGLMQILVRTARLLGLTGPKENLYNPATNVDLGTRYLSNLLTKYQQLGKPLENALSEYNGGSGSKFGGAPAYGPFKNQSYVNNVTNYISYFQAAGSNGETYYSTGDISGSSPTSSPIDWNTVPSTPVVAGSGIVILLLIIGGFLLSKKKKQ